MVRGSRAALEAATAALGAGAGAASVLVAASDGWVDSGGGTSGILWGVGLRAAADSLSDASGNVDVVAAVKAAVQAVMHLGGAVPGDKTLVDVLVPFANTLADEVADGADRVNAWRSGASTAQRAAQATAELAPRVGRARPLVKRSMGHPDAGAPCRWPAAFRRWSEPVRTSAVCHVSGNGARLPAIVATAEAVEYPDT